MSIETGAGVSRQIISDLKGRLLALKEHLDLPYKREELERLERLTLAPDFWNKAEEAQKVQKEHGQIQDVIREWEGWWENIEEYELLLEMAAEENDNEAELEVAEQLRLIQSEIAVAEVECMFSGEHDNSNAIVSIHAGAGGTEAQDWVDILLRMYLRWAEGRGFKTDILDYLPGDEAGVKSVTILFKGRNAYGYLRSELGIHRLVRISPFDSSGRRHTSFASVMVMPELDDSVDVKIEEKDLRVDTYRASGAGGQHVNKTDSAIRLTHLPTNIVVQCQNERSQHRNKDMAMKMLAARLYELEKEKQAEAQEGLSGDKKDIAWGSQIRSYVLQPYRMIKDHRTEHETGNVDAVLDGGLDPFIKAYLLWR
ncbi:peptide chain release factor 2 [Desulfopila sp. IMCC35008]|uniref:peptide chain release factor 2 n=1 Tax=Desulfopila sp. IMCC35008 TaxID=2653858 RepID=UPI00197A9683|nr:peptide chain release factor 2 [Desulfopila sp. IMCC35008]